MGLFNVIALAKHHVVRCFPVPEPGKLVSEAFTCLCGQKD